MNEIQAIHNEVVKMFETKLDSPGFDLYFDYAVGNNPYESISIDIHYLNKKLFADEHSYDVVIDINDANLIYFLDDGSSVVIPLSDPECFEKLWQAFIDECSILEESFIEKLKFFDIIKKT